MCLRLFDDPLVNMIVYYTKLCGHREKVDISFEITNETFRLYLDMLLLNEYMSFQTIK